MGISGVYLTFWGYGWGEEIKTAYGDLKKSAVIGNFAKRAVEGAEPFSRQEGVSGGCACGTRAPQVQTPCISRTAPPYEGVLITCFCNTQFVLHMQILHEHRCGFSEKKPSKKRIFTKKMTRKTLFVVR